MPAWLAHDDDGDHPDRGAAPADQHWVALLPGLDPTTMGWKRRDWYLDSSHEAELFDRNGNAGPTIWVDGRVVGGWVQRPDGSIATELLADVDGAERSAIDERADMIERLVDDVRFKVRFPSPCSKRLYA